MLTSNLHSWSTITQKNIQTCKGFNVTARKTETHFQKNKQYTWITKELTFFAGSDL